MTWFTLPDTQADNRAAFFDSDSATRWLAGQPQANVPAMLAGLLTQIETFNGYGAAPDQRFQAMEALRKTLFAVSAQGQRRYEHKPLPLLPAEEAAFASARRLWRASAVAYLHCLRACLEQHPAIAAESAPVTHRVLSCLRMEQMSCYLAGAEPAADFWRLLHATWASAEQLGVGRHSVADRLLRETLESSASGQYCMALMLHLARPFTLSRGQFAALTRWLARWREQARVLTESEANAKSGETAGSAKSRWIALDLSSDQPVHDPLRCADAARWLSLGGVLRKMRERRELLVGGQSPESLKLGSGLSGPDCIALLDTLGDRLRRPRQPAPMPDDGQSIVLAAGLENSYRLLGGGRLKDALTASSSSSFASQLIVEQIAVFGHVVRETDVSSERAAEIWRIVDDSADQLQLTRPLASGDARLALREVLAIRLPLHEDHVLATVSGLYASRDGRLCLDASLLAGKPTALLAEVREKGGGKISGHPAILLTAPNGRGGALLFMPAGLSLRALSIRFLDGQGQVVPGIRLVECIAHDGDSERWAVVVDA